MAPTGGGKSMCFQQPAIDLTGVAIVITPLVALMADQVAALTARGIAGDVPRVEPRRATRTGGASRRALAGEVKLLYIAPERLASERVRRGRAGAAADLAARRSTRRTASATGATTSGRTTCRSATLVERLHPPRLIACTATATPAVRQEIVERLQHAGARRRCCAGSRATTCGWRSRR